MIYTDYMGVVVRLLKQSIRVGDASVVGEAHGTLVRVLPTMNTAVTVVATMIIRMKIIMRGVIAAGDEDAEPAFETLLVTLRKQQPLRVSTGMSTI